MEENKATTIEATVTENNGATVAEVPQKESFAQKFKKSWVWKNRGKIGFGLGTAATFLLANLFSGNRDDDEDTCDSDYDDD